MPEIAYKVNIHVSPTKVFEALTDPRLVRGWWADCAGDGKTGGYMRFEFRARDSTLDGYSRMRIENLVPGKLVEWKCVEQDYQGVNDWIGTTIRFRLGEDGHGGTDLDFAHVDWESTEGSYHRCTGGWEHVLKTSLKKYLETGKGEPYLVQVEKEAANRARK